MKIRNLLMGVAAATLAALTACEEEKPLLGISIDPTELSFDEAGGTALVRVSVKGDGEWNVTVPADAKDWLSVTGNGSTATVKVLENTGTARTAVVKFAALYYSEYVTVSQQGPVAAGDGSLESPFSVAEAVAYVQGLGSDVNSPDKVYVKGTVSSVTEAFSTQFGNGTFVMTDDTGAQFTAYRVLYLGNQRWTASDEQVKEGDEVIVYGNVVNFKGNTPETVSGNAYLYSLNGKTAGGDTGGTDEPKGTGTLEDPFNPAAASAAASALAADTSSSESYYIKGKIASIASNGAFSAQFGNATFYISEDGTTGGTQFYVFRTLYLGNRQWVEGDTQIQVGDEVVVYGKLVNFKGNTPETVANESCLYSLNGQTEGGDSAPAFGVASTQVSVGASATSATIKVTGNVAWSASGRGVDVSPASGEGAGDITVSFDPNTDTENAKTYTVVVSTTAEVATQSYTVTITQAKASSGGGGEVTFALDNTITWTAETDATYKGGYTATQEGIKVGFYQHSSTSTPLAPDQYSIRIYKSSVFIVNAPEGKNLTSITMKANDLNSGQYCKDLKILEGGSGTVSADTSTMQIGPWTGSAGKVVFQAYDAQVRLVSITVTYE